MTLAVMQPYVFPYIGYYQLIQAVDKFVVYDDVAFIKQGWINRNNILLNNQKHLFFVPVKGISSFKKINETAIDYQFDWTKKMLLTMEQSYKKAPQFENVFPIIQNILIEKKENIAALAIDSVIEVCAYLDIKTNIQKTSQHYGNEHLKGKDRVIDICKKEYASHYINPIGGQELYDATDFLKHNIQLNFIKTNYIQYKQFNNEFVPWLSIIDVLMFNPKEDVKILLNNYELI